MLVVGRKKWSIRWIDLRNRIGLIWFFRTYGWGLLDVSWAFHSRISGVWFRQFSVLRRLLLEDYGHMLFILLTIRGRGQLDYLVDLEMLTLLVTSIRDLHITHTIGFSQSKLIFFICSISISQFMLSSLTLLRLACCHNRRLWELLVPNHLDHMRRSLRDSTLHWAWLWLELLRNSEMLAWLFL